jgi:hypothetical protein
MKMPRVIAIATLSIASIVATALPVRAADDALPVPYQSSFRRWKHVKSMVIQKGHSLFEAFGGIHHVYVNDIGAKALRAKEELPTGTVLAFDLLEANASGGALTEGKRKFVAFMIRDPEKYADTEGWGWQAYKGGNPKKPVLKTAADQKACATCHKEVGAKQFVFSEWRR